MQIPVLQRIFTSSASETRVYGSHQHEGEQGCWISIVGISGILKVARNLGESLFNSSVIPMQVWSNFTEAKDVA